VAEGATTTQIRDAYKRSVPTHLPHPSPKPTNIDLPSAALKTHPDRVPAESPERAERTRRFQLVNDAYYTLSDPTRRRDYDAQRKLFPGSSRARPSPHMPGGFTSDPFAEAEAEADANTNTGGAGNAYSWAWNFFTGQQQQQNQGGDASREQTEDAQFADVFEEMLREEGMADPASRPTGKFWGMLGGISGGALGFIVANVPGLLAGAVAGNRLGAVRDAKGKSVYAVFQVSASGVVMVREDGL
jgi:hypothetical protein